MIGGTMIGVGLAAICVSLYYLTTGAPYYQDAINVYNDAVAP